MYLNPLMKWQKISIRLISLYFAVDLVLVMNQMDLVNLLQMY